MIVRVITWAIVLGVCYGGYSAWNAWHSPWSIGQSATAALAPSPSPSASAALAIPGCGDKPDCTQ